MEETATITPIVQEPWFTVGKALGMETKPQPIDDFFKALDKAGELLAEKRKAELTKLDAHCTSIRTALVTLETDMTTAVNKFLTSSTELLGNYKKLLDVDDTIKDQIKPKAEELYQLGFERLKARDQQAIAAESAIKEKIHSFELQSDALIKQAATANANYTEELKKAQKDYASLREGYLYGQALKEAQTKKP